MLISGILANNGAVCPLGMLFMLRPAARLAASKQCHLRPPFISHTRHTQIVAILAVRSDPAPRHFNEVPPLKCLVPWSLDL